MIHKDSRLIWRLQFLRVDLYQNESEKISFYASDIRITKLLLTIGDIHIDDR